MKTLIRSLFLIALCASVLSAASVLPTRVEDSRAVYLEAPAFDVRADGVADDSAAIQAAIDKAATENPGESKLIFVKQDGRHMLQRIDTPTIDMKFKTESSSRLARADVPKPEIVAVVLR